MSREDVKVRRGGQAKATQPHRDRTKYRRAGLEEDLGPTAEELERWELIRQSVDADVESDKRTPAYPSRLDPADD